jgi:hypothetical protein
VITKKSLIFGVNELIKVMDEADVPDVLYRLMYELEHRHRKPIEENIQTLHDVLAGYDLPIVCPRCTNKLPACSVCLFCGHYFVRRQFDPETANVLREFKPFKAGSQREIVWRAFCEGVTTHEIVQRVTAACPGIQRQTVLNNINIYTSTWRKTFGWEIVRKDGIIKLIDTHGNG